MRPYESPPGPAGPGFVLQRLEVSGQRMACVVYTPENRAGARPPAILFLHGRGECGDDGWKHVRNSSIAQAVMAAPDRWPFVIVMPQKPDGDAQWEDFDAIVMALLDAAIREHGVDPARVYLTGLSQGGHGTWKFAAVHPNRFAAIAPICGYINPDFRNAPPDAAEAAEIAARLDAMPVWCFHGRADDIVPAAHSEAMMRAIRARRGAQGACEAPEAKLTIYPGVKHNAWDEAYAEPELPGWLLRFRR